MAQLSEEAKKIISEVHPALVATANKAGKLNISPKGSFRVLDDEHCVFIDVASPRTIANLKENPQLSAIIFDPPTRKGCRIWGTAEVFESGPDFDSIVSAPGGATRRPPNHAIRIVVEQVETF